MEYGRIKYDIFFKKVFGQKAHITRAFLNTVLRDDLKAPIKTVSFEPTDFIVKGKNALINSTKHDVIDIFCVDEEGHRILIEIQKGGSKLALPRFLDYQCRNYSSQFLPNDKYKNVVGCYSVCWMFDINPPHKSLSEKIRLCSNETETDWVFDWQITALYPRNLGNLEDLKKQLMEEHDISLAEWLVLDVVTDQEKAAAIKDVLQHEEVKEAFEDLDLSGYTEDQIREAAYKEEYGDLVERDVAKVKAKAEKEKKEALQKAEKEKKDALQKAEKEKKDALQKVEEEAEKKRREALLDQKISIAKSMFGLVDLETISKATGLSIEMLKEINS